MTNPEADDRARRHPADAKIAAMPADAVVEPFDVTRICPGALVALPEGPFGTVVEVMMGAWTAKATRIWIDYGTHIDCYVAARASEAPSVGEPKARMILPPSQGTAQPHTRHPQ